MKASSLIKRIEEAVQWNYLTPNVTLRAEWDIESVILSTYRDLAMQFSFLHVYSHQDDDAPAETLPLETRLNIEADWRQNTWFKTKSGDQKSHSSHLQKSN
jgi:hypothetical protein